MGWVYGVDIIVLVTLINVGTRRGLERALPVFAFFITLLPEECHIPLPGLFDLYTHRLALIVMTVLFCAKNKRSAIRILPLKNLLIMHGGWLLLSTLTSIVVMTSAKQFIAQVLEYYVIFFIMVKTITDVETVFKIVFSMVAAVGVACIFGLIEIYFQWTVLSLFPADLQEFYGTGGPIYTELLDRGIRVRSTFAHPILFGGAISMMIPFALYLSTTAKRRLQRAALAMFLILMLWNIYKTSSRGPWLATAVSMIVFFLAANGKVRKQFLLIGALVILVLLTRPGVKDTIVNTYRATMDTNTQMGMSFAYRPALFRAVTKTLNDDPFRALVGFGLNSFRQKGLIIVLPGIDTHIWYTCDSAWLLFAYETGYVGLLLITAILFKPAVMAFNAYRTLPRKYRYFCATCGSSLLSFFIVMISVAAYGWGQNGSMLWIVNAITVSYVILKKREAEHGQKLPSRSVDATVVGV